MDIIAVKDGAAALEDVTNVPLGQDIKDDATGGWNDAWFGHGYSFSISTFSRKRLVILSEGASSSVRSVWVVATIRVLPSARATFCILKATHFAVTRSSTAPNSSATQTSVGMLMSIASFRR